MPESTRPHTAAPTRSARHPVRAELRAGRRRRSVARVSDGVVAAYIHEISGRHPHLRTRSTTSS